MSVDYISANPLSANKLQNIETSIYHFKHKGVPGFGHTHLQLTPVYVLIENLLLILWFLAEFQKHPQECVIEIIEAMIANILSWMKD